MNNALQKIFNPTPEDIKKKEENAALGLYKVEEFDCLTQWLNDNKVPIANGDGRVYSTVGRVEELVRMRKEMRIGLDGICPVSSEHCDDECCPVGAECNIYGTGYITPVNDEIE